MREALLWIGVPVLALVGMYGITLLLVKLSRRFEGTTGPWRKKKP